jgi:hypothetical protein
VYFFICFSVLPPSDNSIAVSNNNNNDINNNNNKHWDEHVPKSVETSRGCTLTILWNQQVQIDRTTPNNKPEVVIRDCEKGTCMLIDVAIPGDRNVIQKESENILKYKYLTIRNTAYVEYKG